MFLTLCSKGPKFRIRNLECLLGSIYLFFIELMILLDLGNYLKTLGATSPPGSLHIWLWYLLGPPLEPYEVNFLLGISLKNWIDKYGFCNVYIHTINTSWLKEREWTSVCLVVFYRIIEKLQKTTTDYITHHVEQDYPKRIGNTRKWLIWSSARQKMHSTKVYSINIASGRQWHNMVSFAFLQTSINVKIQMEV